MITYAPSNYVEDGSSHEVKVKTARGVSIFGIDRGTTRGSRSSQVEADGRTYPIGYTVG